MQKPIRTALEDKILAVMPGLVRENILTVFVESSFDHSSAGEEENLKILATCKATLRASLTFDDGDCDLTPLFTDFLDNSFLTVTVDEVDRHIELEKMRHKSEGPKDHYRQENIYWDIEYYITKQLEPPDEITPEPGEGETDDTELENIVT